MNAIASQDHLYPSLEELVVDRKAVQAIALQNSFVLKPQGNGKEDLHPYAYAFCGALAKQVQTEATRTLSRLLSDILDECQREEWDYATKQLRAVYRRACALLGRDPEQDQPLPSPASCVSITNERIREIALESGFSLKPQSEKDKHDLNPYVYSFAQAVIQHIEQEKARQLVASLSAVLDSCEELGWPDNLSFPQALYLHACIVIGRYWGS